MYVFVYICAIFMLFVSSVFANSSSRPDHTYSFTQEHGSSVYEENVGALEANDVFRTENITFTNRFNFSYADNSNEAITSDVSRFSDIFIVKTENYRFTTIARAAFFSGSDFMDNFQYAFSVERTMKLDEGDQLDFGLAVTNFAIYNRVYPGPVILPIISWTTHLGPSTICRIGVPTMIMYRGAKWGMGFNYAPVFNSKFFAYLMPLSFFKTELYIYSHKTRLAIGDPTRNEVLHMFYSGVFWENTFFVSNNISILLGGGCNIFERSWVGNQMNLLSGREQGASYRIKVGITAMF